MTDNTPYPLQGMSGPSEIDHLTLALGLMTSERDALLAENQQLRDALERIEQVACEFGYTGDERDSCACPACETLVIAREALAGDAE